MNFTHRVAIAEQNNEEKMELRGIIRVSAKKVSAYVLGNASVDCFGRSYRGP